MTADHPSTDLPLLLTGDLTAADRLRVQSHLTGCSRCSDDLADLRLVRQHVDRADPAQVLEQLARDGLVRPAAAPARARRWLIAAAACVVLIAGAGVAGGLIAEQHRSPQAVLALTGSGASGTLRLTGTGAQTRIRVAVSGLPRGEHCTLLLIKKDGSRQPVTSWTASYAGGAQVEAVAAVPLDQLTSAVVAEEGTDVTLLAGTLG